MQFKFNHKKHKQKHRREHRAKPVKMKCMLSSLSQLRDGLQQRGMAEALVCLGTLEHLVLLAAEQEARAERQGHEQLAETRAAKKARLREGAARAKQESAARRSGNLVDRTAQAIGHASYDNYLKSEHWTTTQLLYARAWPGCSCVACGSDHYQLHHVSYKRLGREMLRDLIPLCEPCHKSNRIPVRDYGRAMCHAFGWEPAELDRRLDRFHSLPDATVLSSAGYIGRGRASGA